MNPVHLGGADGVDGAVVRVAATSSLRPRLDVAATSLEGATAERWRRLRREQDRADFLAARILAADAVRELLTVEEDVGFEQRCTQCGGAHGRPVVTSHEAHVSWAHAHGVVAAAAMHHGPIGIDVEHLQPDDAIPDLGLPGRAFVRAEAVVKAGALPLEQALQEHLDWPFGMGSSTLGLDVQDLARPDLGVIGAIAAPMAPSSE